jgi:predicted dehydrogenase
MKQPIFRLALVGCGGQAGGDVPELASHPAVKIVATCDPDKNNRDRFAQKYGVAEEARFADYKQMLKNMRGQLEGVFIATPDHMHAPVGLASLRENLHVYQQKPLARSVGECRALANLVKRRPKLATQMGIQIHAAPAYRTSVAWLKAGVLGRVTEVHSFCGKGWGGAVEMEEADPVPETLDWDTYCGVSPVRPYVIGFYHPGNWRKWQAFGTGTLGDMACHILDPIFGGLELSSPLSVTSLLEAPPNSENYPYNAHIVWQFPQNISLHWYHGDTRPAAETLPGVNLPGSGSVIIGERGRMLLPHWAIPTVYDSSGKKRTDLPPVLPEDNHYHEWVDVAIGKKKERCGADFRYASLLTEMVLLGNIASWTPTQTLEWDGKRCRFKGRGKEIDDANRLILPLYRKGTVIPDLKI